MLESANASRIVILHLGAQVALAAALLAVVVWALVGSRRTWLPARARSATLAVSALSAAALLL
jgi:hypothetical protein